MFYGENQVNKQAMTDRVKGFTVTLEKDYREDDVEFIQNAISAIRGVAHVEQNIVTHEDHMNRERIKAELRTMFYEFYKETFK